MVLLLLVLLPSMPRKALLLLAGQAHLAAVHWLLCVRVSCRFAHPDSFIRLLLLLLLDSSCCLPNWINAAAALLLLLTTNIRRWRQWLKHGICQPIMLLLVHCHCSSRA
jgi:hypothetical protein